MAGPPTPPPEATPIATDPPAPAPEAQPAEVPVPATTSPAPDNYGPLVQYPVSLIAQGNYEPAIFELEYHDKQFADVNTEARLLFVAPLVLIHLVKDQVSLANQALTRLPENVQAHPLAKSLLALIASTWDRTHSNVYPRATALRHSARQPAFVDPRIAESIVQLIDTFVGSFRERAFLLISKAYTSIKLPLAQTYLGLPAEEVTAAAIEHGWTFDASLGILTPATYVPASRAPSAPSSLKTFNIVADAVAQLEM